MRSSNKQAALSYAEKGWKVFPVTPCFKTPLAALAPNGHKDATSDKITIDQWWTERPNANIGLYLAASGLVCVDVDSYKEGCAFDNLRRTHEFPQTLMQKSARGGTHFIFATPKSAEFPGRLGFGVDVKYNGYILLAPSTFDAGSYSWINDLTPADAPGWLPKGKPNTLKGRVHKAPTQTQAFEPRSSLDVSQLRNEAAQGVDWHNNVLRLVGHQVAHGYTDLEIHKTTDSLTLIDYTIEQTRCEVQRMIDGARIKGFDGQPAANLEQAPLPFFDLHNDNRGNPICNHSNLVKLLTMHPDWRGAFATDEFSGKRKVLQAIPHHHNNNDIFQPRQLEDEDYTRVSMWLNDNRMMHTAKDIVVGAVAKACSEQSFNVVKDYLERCQLIGKGNDQLLDHWMLQFLGVEPVNEKQKLYVKAVSRLSLIQAVARVFKPGCKADSVIMLEGKQGTGKSACLSVLFSPDYFGDQLPQMTSKDASSYLRGKWCIELAELEYKRKTEIETIKAFISRTQEDYRPAFGREEIIQPRTCVFWGTTNKDDYLNDETGNRRFLPIKTNAIDLEGLRKSRDAIWGAAVSAYLSGEAYWLSGNLSEIAADEAKGRMEQDPWCELILANMSGMGEASIRDAFMKCFNDGFEENRTTAESRRMSKALILCGWERAGKFTCGDLRNQVMFVNPSPTEGGSEQDNHFDF
jgi:hypothetical protein